MRIEAEDILKSRVFSDTEHDNPDGVRDTEDTRADDAPDDVDQNVASSGGNKDNETKPSGDDWSVRADTTSDDDEVGPGTIEFGLDRDAIDEPAGGPESQAAAPG